MRRTHVLSEPNNQGSIIVKGLQECTIITYELFCVVGLNQRRCWQRAKTRWSSGQTHTHVVLTDPRSEQTTHTRTHTQTHTRAPVLVSHYCVRSDLSLCSVYQMGPRSLWRDNTVTGPWAARAVASSIHFPPKNIKCQAADYNVPFRKKKSCKICINTISLTNKYINIFIIININLLLHSLCLSNVRKKFKLLICK